jgi:hypothetical protein
MAAAGARRSRAARIGWKPHNGFRLEALGCPVAGVVTTEFLHEAEMHRDALGLADLVPVVIDPPLGTLTEAEIDARAVHAVPQYVAVWRGG